MKYTNPNIQQQIEAYLRQEMTDLERSGFERMMHENPELHEEVKHQESLITAIRKERVLQLKAGLQAVPVSLWSATLLEYAKIAAISAGIGLASVGGYLYLNRNAAEIPGQSKKTETVAEQKAPVSDAGNQQADIYQTPRPAVEPAPSNNPSPAAGHTQPAESVNDSRKIPVQSGSIVLQDPEIAEPLMKSSQPETPQNLALPEDGLSSKTHPESMQPEVVMKRGNREKFHYQFSEGKLVLYADFSEKLYEVLELNQHGQQSLFLSYDGKFYSLDPMMNEISPLQEVKDKNLVQILSVYQKRK